MKKEKTQALWPSILFSVALAAVALLLADCGNPPPAGMNPTVNLFSIEDTGGSGFENASSGMVSGFYGVIKRDGEVITNQPFTLGPRDHIYFTDVDGVWIRSADADWFNRSNEQRAAWATHAFGGLDAAGQAFAPHGFTAGGEIEFARDQKVHQPF